MAVTTGTTVATSTITATTHTTSAATVDRSQHRAATRDLRDNAGIDLRDKVEAVEAVADFGAAARRLRESVRGGEDAPRQRCFNPASVRAAAAAAAPVDDIVVVDPPLDGATAVEGKKRESVTLKYLRTRKAAKA